MKAKDQDRVETVTYRKDAQKAVIRYVSTNGNRVLTTDEVTGKSGEAIAYSTTCCEFIADKLITLFLEFCDLTCCAVGNGFS